MGEDYGVRKPVPGKALLPTRDDQHNCKLMQKICLKAMLYN